jgi:hypothetical protein
MKRLLLILALAGAALLGPSVVSAQAAATCATHSGALYKWSTQDDWLGYNADFKCGGAENTRWRIKVSVQIDLGSAGNPDWYLAQCDAGACYTWRPSSSTWFAAGSEQAWGDGKFNYAGQIDGNTFRMRYDVDFQNGDPRQTWYSSKVTP